MTTTTTTMKIKQMDPNKILHGILFVAAIFVLILSTANMTCFTLLFVDLGFSRYYVDDEMPPDNPVIQTCRILWNVFAMGDERDDNDAFGKSWQDTEGLLVKGFAIPFLILSCSMYLLKRNSQITFFPNIRGGGGDPNIQFWTIVFVLFPCLLVTLYPQIATSKEVWSAVMERNGTEEWQSRLSRFAAITGDAAVMALSLFLIPVAKHSPLIHVFGLSFTQALAFHRIAGWISLVFTILHGGLYLVDYGTFFLDGNNLNSNRGQGGFQAVMDEVIPPLRCWTFDALFYHSTGWGTMKNTTARNNTDESSSSSSSSSSNNNNTIRLSSFTSDIEDYAKLYHNDHYECNYYYFNFSGFISMMAFIILGIFSLPYVRRKAYWLFYTVHIPAAWIMLLGAIVHITYISLFLVPNIIYYFAPTVSVWIQQFISARKEKGIRIESVTKIYDSNGCCLVRLRRPQSSTEEETNFGAVCKICIPKISAIWHPFSTMKDPTNGDFLFLIRPTGPFTKEFLNHFTTMTPAPEEEQRRSDEEDLAVEIPLLQGTSSLSTQTPPLTVLVDGIYPAEYRWYAKFLQHQSVLLVAGGVGIVPFLPLLSELYHTLSSSAAAGKGNTRHVALHWYCREEGLARYVCKEFLQWYLQGADIIRDDDGGDNVEESGSTNNEFEQQDDENFHNEELIANETARSITFEVFIHVTSRSRNEEDYDFLTSFLSQTESSDDESNPSSASSNDTTVKIMNDVSGSSAPFKKAYIATTNSWSQNLFRLFWFTSLILTCSILSWWYYKLETVIGGGHSIVIRIHVVLYSLGISASFAILLIWLCNQGYYNQGSVSIPNTAINIDTSSTQTGVSPTSTNRIVKRISVTSGRPTVEEVIKPVVRSTNSGAMFCGPQKLRNSLKNAIRSGERSSCTISTTPCAFYDEESDM